MVSQGNHEIAIKSSITGNHNNIQYYVKYLIKTTLNWNVVSFDIKYVLNGSRYSISASHVMDSWIINGQLREEFKNCIDIDITLTPFTNTLPIKRLNFQPTKPQPIEVLYIDVLENSIRVARQQYTKNSDTEYNFQNVPNDFEADIIVDNDGFVVHYPELFERIET
jgi:hypothetical protein